MTNPKETVFSSRDLFHCIMDFLPDEEPISAMTVSKGWSCSGCKYKLPNLMFEPGHQYEDFCDRTSLLPSYMKLYMNLSVKNPHLIQKIKFIHDRLNNNHNVLHIFPNLFELTIESDNLPLELSNFPVSLRTLKICEHNSGGRKLAFYGGDLENLHSLDLSELFHISSSSVLPPNLEKLLMPRKCTSFSLDSPFPGTLKTLIYHHVEGELLPNILPKGLKHLEIFSKFGGNNTAGELILPPDITYLDLGQGHMAPLNIASQKVNQSIRVRCIHKHILVVQWHPFLTRVKIDNDSLTEIRLDTMPPTLTDLEFNVSDYTPFISENLPYSVLSLTLHLADNYHPEFRKLPPCLRSLKLYMKEGASLLANDLPESITSLNLISYGSYRLELKDNVLPSNLQYLSLSAFITPLKTKLPASLTFLDASSYDDPFDKGILPNSLTTLELCEDYGLDNLSKSWFPRSLDYINIGKIKFATPHKIG